jgi:general secretion pathway protein A
MLQDLGAIRSGDSGQARLAAATLTELMREVDDFLLSLHESNEGAMLIIDEAHSLPPATLQQLIEVAHLESNRHKVMRFLLAGQPAIGGNALPFGGVNNRSTMRARLLPLERDECEHYVHHRLTIAGGAEVTFNLQSIEVIYALSGGLPRLINLLCERALQEAASAQANRVEAAMVASAASALDLMRIRPRRFRWYGTR